MNKKLMRLEYIETKKIMFLITALIAVYMLISTGCAIASNYSTPESIVYIQIVQTILLIISALLIICTGLIMVKRYYNILFTNEGYSRLSFPVRNQMHLIANMRFAFVWIILQILVFIFGLSISDMAQKYAIDQSGILNLYPNVLEGYTYNVLGEFIAHPEIKAMITVLLLIIASVAIGLNIYLSFIFSLTISSFICSKFNIVQKYGVIVLTGIFMYLFHLLATRLFYKLWVRVGNDFLLTNSGYETFGPDIMFFQDIYKPIILILFYGITAIIMCQISKNILDKKLDI